MADEKQQQAPTVINVIPAQNAADIGRDYQARLYAQCAEGLHVRKTEYGPCGIITAVACFPIGLICLFMDTQYKCARCGEPLPS